MKDWQNSMRVFYSNRREEYCFVDGTFISRGGRISFNPTEIANERLRIREDLSNIEYQVSLGELLSPNVPSVHTSELSELFHEGSSESSMYFKALEILELIREDAKYQQMINLLKSLSEQSDTANDWKYGRNQNNFQDPKPSGDDIDDDEQLAY